jgi:hypothetical protein
MIKQTHDIESLLRTLAPYIHELEGFSAEAWLEQEPNICLTDGKGSFALFEYNTRGIYTGHYFFVVRGKAALKLAKEFLDFLFKNYEVELIRGLTPLEKLGARWMNRKLGFTSYGVVKTIVGPCELVILTNQEYENELALRR